MNIGTHKNTLTLTAGADIAQGACVKLDANDASKAAICGAEDAACLGAALDDCKAGDVVAVRLFGLANETANCIASGAIKPGATVVLDAGGKVKSGSAGVVVGIALTEAFADGQPVEVLHRAPATVAAGE